MTRNKIPIKLIKLYQKNKQIIGSGHCRFYPTCSNYALEAYQKFNFFYASWLTIWRIIRCNPLTKRKYNPVPLSKKEKEQKRVLEQILKTNLAELAYTLINHYLRYPLSEIEDYLKLIFQHYYGPQHLVSENDEEKLQNYLYSEIKTINKPNDYYFDDIGNGFTRFDLRLIETDDDLKRLTLAFIKTCRKITAPPTSFQDGVNLLKTLIDNKVIPLAKEVDFEQYLHPRMHSHSKIYKEMYDPHYRLIRSNLIPFEFYQKAINTLINKSIKAKSRLIIAIDGPSGGGKTTLSKQLGKYLKADIYHLDDFFLPNKMKTKRRLKQIGANFHYERFIKEVLLPIKANLPFEYRKYNCQTNTYELTKATNEANIIIIEGVYSMHPLLITHYDLLIFVDIDEIKQKKRLRNRSNDAIYQKFINQWLPLEERYFTHYQIKAKADLIINGNAILK